MDFLHGVDDFLDGGSQTSVHPRCQGVRILPTWLVSGQQQHEKTPLRVPFCQVQVLVPFIIFEVLVRFRLVKRMKVD